MRYAGHQQWDTELTSHLPDKSIPTLSLPVLPWVNPLRQSALSLSLSLVFLLLTLFNRLKEQATVCTMCLNSSELRVCPHSDIYWRC
jgi:hypothetical protein